MDSRDSVKNHGGTGSFDQRTSNSMAVLIIYAIIPKHLMVRFIDAYGGTVYVIDNFILLRPASF